MQTGASGRTAGYALAGGLQTGVEYASTFVPGTAFTELATEVVEERPWTSPRAGANLLSCSAAPWAGTTLPSCSALHKVEAANFEQVG